MKLELFTIFDRFAKAGAIFASTACSLSITDLTDVVVSRERCIGMHFSHAVSKSNLLRLLRTPYTSEDTVATCREVACRMGKEVAVVNESAAECIKAGSLRRSEENMKPLADRIL